MNTCIAIVGLSLVDRVYHVNQLPNSRGKYFAHGYHESVGGIAANAALAAKQLDANVHLVSRIGADDNGRWLIKQMAGINLHNVAILKNLDTPSSSVCVDKSGERLIVNYTSPDLLDHKIPASFTLDKEIQAVMCDLRWIQGASVALQWAQDNERPGLLDFDQAPSIDSAELLKFASHTVFGEHALLELTGCTQTIDALVQISEKYPEAYLAVTLGEHGVQWKEPHGTIQHMASRTVKAVDTLGAGDVFHGACTVALAESMTFEQALRFASDVASLKVTLTGGTKNLPNRSQVTEFIRNNPL